jgi:general secretion pathway protein C
MHVNSHHVWGPRVATLLLAALATASAAYWALKWSAPDGQSVAPVAAMDEAPADTQAVARLLGGVTAASVASASPSAASRFVLVGVLASAGTHGAALISVDGKPAKPYAVGSPVAENLVLLSVAGRRAVLAASDNAAPALTLEMKTLSR